MSVISVIINILAIVALVIIITYAARYLYLYVRKKESEKIAKSINPPGSYMQNSGIKCPDYWVNTGFDSSGNYICKNSFNIPSNNPTTGIATGKCNFKEMVFPPVENNYTWEYGNPNGLTSYSDEDKYNLLNKAVPGSISRCNWVNYCGANPSIQGIWSGVNEICHNYPSS
jgi:hypothetical protein